MIVAMKADATPDEIQAVVDRITSFNLKALNMPGGERTAIGIASAIPPDLRETLAELLGAMPGVDRVTHVSRAYKLASREFHPADTVITVKGVSIGANEVVVAAGPCAIEGREQLFEAAKAVKEHGAKILRGGAFKPRTNPYSFQGLGIEGLKLLKEAGEQFDLVTVTEIIDQHDLDTVAAHADILQVGARNMQNYPLLTALGKATQPVVLKRGISATIDEWLLAAEYILAQGNESVILCERGVHPLDREHTRYTLDLSAVPVVKTLSHLPVIVDPSHACGNWRYVASMSKAAIAAGADGLLMEVHPDPPRALCDGSQSLRIETFASLMKELRAVASAVGRSLV
ncbi:MAG: 3-deoxy-7-phosphoheptulonate synthase [Armatimonadetes bacterium]|nr:3-deoxy-7-phosphoheptulonate synthase [Armatimonadota bacterium]